MFTQMAKITDNLYISAASAITLDKLRRSGITLIINCTKEIPLLNIPDIESVKISVEDTSNISHQHPLRQMRRQDKSRPWQRRSYACSLRRRYQSIGERLHRISHEIPSFESQRLVQFSQVSPFLHSPESWVLSSTHRVWKEDIWFDHGDHGIIASRIHSWCIQKWSRQCRPHAIASCIQPIQIDNAATRLMQIE